MKGKFNMQSLLSLSIFKMITNTMAVDLGDMALREVATITTLLQGIPVTIDTINVYCKHSHPHNLAVLQ